MGEQPELPLVGDEAGGNPEGAPVAEGQQGKSDSVAQNMEALKKELDVLKGRYEESSAEGKRLAARLQSYEQQSSLTNQQQKEPGFPDEDTFVKGLVENDEFTEKQARRQYKVERFFWESNRALQDANKALANQIKFGGQQMEAALADNNPMAREANEMFKDIPELDALPITEKIARYKAIQERVKPKITGRDLSAVKGAAGSITGSSGKSPSMGTSDREALARSMLKMSSAQMDALSKCSTAEEYAAYKQKWKVR